MLKIQINSNQSLKEEVTLDIQDPIIDSNIKILYKSFNDIFSYEPNKLKLIQKIIANIPQLQKFKLRKKLGNGAYGVAFEFRNGLILKLYKGDYQVPANDRIYTNQNKQLFSKKANLNTLNVISNGTIKLDSGENPYIYYVIMSKFNIVLNDWLSKNAGFTDFLSLEPVLKYIFRFNENALYKYWLKILNNDIKMHMHRQQFGAVNFYKQKLQFMQKNPEFMISYLKAIKNYMKENEVSGDYSDLHSGNIGMQELEDGTFNFVVFDGVV